MEETAYHSTLVAVDLGLDLRRSLEAACVKRGVSKSDFIRSALRDALETRGGPIFRLEVLRQFVASMGDILAVAADEGLIKRELWFEARVLCHSLRVEIEEKQGQLEEKAVPREPDAKSPASNTPAGFPPSASVESIAESHLVDDILAGVYRVRDFFTGDRYADFVLDPKERQRELERAKKDERRLQVKKAR